MHCPDHHWCVLTESEATEAGQGIRSHGPNAHHHLHRLAPAGVFHHHALPQDHVPLRSTHCPCGLVQVDDAGTSEMQRRVGYGTSCHRPESRSDGCRLLWVSHSQRHRRSVSPPQLPWHETSGTGWLPIYRCVCLVDVWRCTSSV